MNIGDLVRIAQFSDCVNAPTTMGIIVEEHELCFHALSDGTEIDKSFPELHYQVYDFNQGEVLLYHSFELKILNKMSPGTSYKRGV
jgi:hypothetical protein